MASNRQILLILPILLVLTIHLTINEIFAQIGSTYGYGLDADYGVSIVPGASQQNNTYHYFPPKIAVPTDTTVAWLNQDVGQPHTVTSGQPGAADSGSVFNSGIMPAFPVRSFEYTFSQSGEFSYYCIIHPWRVASVSVSDAQFTGISFDIGLGSGATWNLSTTPRVLLDVIPKLAVLDGVTPISYKVTIKDSQTNKTMFSDGATIKDSQTNKTMFSDIFTTGGESLKLELVSGEGNETRSYGPDFTTTGAYHVQSDFKKDSSYSISVAVVAYGDKPIEKPVKGTFNLQTSP
jgi:plastocyanin